MSGEPNGERRIRSGRLVLRIYLLTVVVLGIVAASFYTMRSIVFERPWKRVAAQQARYLVSQMAAHLGDHAALEQERRRLRQELGAFVSLFGEDGAVLITSPNRPAPPLSPEIRAQLAQAGETMLNVSPHARTIGVAVGDRDHIRAYGVITLPRLIPTLSDNLVMLAGILLCLGVVSVLFARLLANPLERLAQAARAFGSGDLSARVNLHRRDEFGDVARAFDEMAERLSALLRSQKELLANVSHELRSPLSRIQVALDIAAEEETTLSRETLAGIAEDLAELERLVDDVLTTARLDLTTGRAGEPAPRLRAERLDPRSLLEKSAARFRAAHPTHQLELDAAVELPELEADPTLLRRAIDNLLDNAGKYSEPGSTVRLLARAVGGQLVLEVTDAGIGIDESDRAHLFTPFFRTDRSRARATGGVGLGLALARRIIEAHDGTLALDSRPGVGTTVRITLPARPPESAIHSS